MIDHSVIQPETSPFTRPESTVFKHTASDSTLDVMKLIALLRIAGSGIPISIH